MRRRLFLVTLAVTTLLVAAFAFPLAMLVREVAKDRALTEAERDQAALAPVLVGGRSPEVLAGALAGTTSGRDGRFAVLLPDGTQLGDDARLDTDGVELAREEQRAFSQTTEGGIDVFSPVVVSAGEDGDTEVVVLRVFVPDALLTDGVSTAWLVLALVAVVLVAVAVLATDRLARSVTRPSAELAATSRALAGGDTSARATVDGPPEIADVAEAINLLADRIEELLAGERERVADLSHRLRTPLTALRLDAEAHGASVLVDDVDRLEAEVSDLIRAARLPLHEEVAVRCDLADVVEDRAAFWGALADDDGRTWTCEVQPPGPHLVRLDGGSVAAALDVLLGNVFAHTPDGTPYALAVHAHDGRAQLVVEDAGAGIVDPTAVLDRGASGGGSTGLGLDIAATTARAGGGELRVERSDGLGGARLVIDLPTLDEAR